MKVTTAVEQPCTCEVGATGPWWCHRHGRGLLVNLPRMVPRYEDHGAAQPPREGAAPGESQPARPKDKAPAPPDPVLPDDATERKAIPLVTGLLDYFPLALAEVARLSKIGNEQHNPGQPMHWARSKSTDHADTIGRHLLDRGTVDKDGVRHSVKVAWRALALLQEELEAAGGKPGRASRWDKPQ